MADRCPIGLPSLDFHSSSIQFVKWLRRGKSSTILLTRRRIQFSLLIRLLYCKYYIIIILNCILPYNSNQIIFIGLRSSEDCYKLPGGNVSVWEGSLGCEFLHGSMCAEGMGCGRRWLRWVLRGTWIASGHLGVPWQI